MCSWMMMSVVEVEVPSRIVRTSPRVRVLARVLVSLRVMALMRCQWFVLY